jgi:hypothetical protein
MVDRGARVQSVEGRDIDNRVSMGLGLSNIFISAVHMEDKCNCRVFIPGISTPAMLMNFSSTFCASLMTAYLMRHHEYEFGFECSRFSVGGGLLEKGSSSSKASSSSSSTSSDSSPES